jgi:hypothetical protein
LGLFPGPRFALIPQTNSGASHVMVAKDFGHVSRWSAGARVP